MKTLSSHLYLKIYDPSKQSHTLPSRTSRCTSQNLAKCVSVPTHNRQTINTKDRRPAPTAGSRNCEIVLVENIDIQDQYFNSAFTIKTYSCEKIVTDEGWNHSSIVLRPNSFDDSFKNIIINKENGKNMRIVGVFVKILN